MLHKFEQVASHMRSGLEWKRERYTDLALFPSSSSSRLVGPEVDCVLFTGLFFICLQVAEDDDDDFEDEEDEDA